MNEHQLRQRFPHASRGFIKANSQIPDSQPQHPDAPPLELVSQGTEEMSRRFVCRIKSRRVRAVDPDNLAAGCKAVLDLLRNGSLIWDDDPASLVLEISQEKVKTYAQEETIIEITPL
jgi:hypothetical protein